MDTSVWRAHPHRDPHLPLVPVRGHLLHRWHAVLLLRGLRLRVAGQVGKHKLFRYSNWEFIFCLLHEPMFIKTFENILYAPRCNWFTTLNLGPCFQLCQWQKQSRTMQTERLMHCITQHVLILKQQKSAKSAGDKCSYGRCIKHIVNYQAMFMFWKRSGFGLK